MHLFAMETAAILVHSLNRFSLCTKMAAVAVARLLLCCNIICKRSIMEVFPNGGHYRVTLQGFPEMHNYCYHSLSLSALELGDYKTADSIHVGLMVDHVSEVSQWLVGVKKIVATLKFS